MASLRCYQDLTLWGYHLGSTKEMKRGFIVHDDGHLTSALVPIASLDVLNLGDRITVSRPLDLGYAAQIKTGEQGTVDNVDAHTGFVEILMDTFHRGLFEWHNHIWLEPFQTEDILSGIVCTCALVIARSVA